MAALATGTGRGSSLVENLNSRLRSDFFLRRYLGPDYFALLQSVTQARFCNKRGGTLNNA